MNYFNMFISPTVLFHLLNFKTIAKYIWAKSYLKYEAVVCETPGSVKKRSKNKQVSCRFSGSSNLLKRISRPMIATSDETEK